MTKYPVSHDLCGKTAVMYVGNGDPYRDGMLLACDFEHVDGRPCAPGEEILCDACGVGYQLIGQDGESMRAVLLIGQDIESMRAV